EIKRLVRLSGSHSGAPAAAGAADTRSVDARPLPSIREFPDWQQCVARNEIIRCTASETSVTTLFPINGAREAVGLLVIEAQAPLAARETDLVQGILGILRNHLALLDYGELDSLTGMLNRKTFEGHFDKLRQRLVAPQPGELNRAGEPSWLALI